MCASQVGRAVGRKETGLRAALQPSLSSAVPGDETCGFRFRSSGWEILQSQPVPSDAPAAGPGPAHFE